MMAYKRPQNLLEKISKARISNHIYKPPGFQNCSSTECQLHTSTNISSNFTSETTKENFNILQNLNCDSHNVIYLISCKKPNCGQQYVGETGRHLRERVLEHLRNIRTRKSCPVAAHFGSLFHKTEHFSIQAIEKCKIHTTFYRKTRERFWINRLKPAINQQHKTQFKSSNINKRFQKKMLSKNSRPLKKRKKSHPWGRLYSIMGKLSMMKNPSYLHEISFKIKLFTSHWSKLNLFDTQLPLSLDFTFKISAHSPKKLEISTEMS